MLIRRCTQFHLATWNTTRKYSHVVVHSSAVVVRHPDPLEFRLIDLVFFSSSSDLPGCIQVAFARTSREFIYLRIRRAWSRDANAKLCNLNDLARLSLCLRSLGDDHRQSLFRIRDRLQMQKSKIYNRRFNRADILILCDVPFYGHFLILCCKCLASIPKF